MKIVIIDYGAGNVFSVKNTLERLGYSAKITYEPKEIGRADRVIFPGVGQASSAMKQLKKYNLDKLIPSLDMPVLGICLGMQLMCSSTQEDDTPGMGIFPVEVLKITGKEKIPHMGWNNIFDLKGSLFRDIPEQERMYFVHSYYLPDNDYTIARCDYHSVFAAAVAKDNFFGCQFHPEKSSGSGEQLLLNFIKG